MEETTTTNNLSFNSTWTIEQFKSIHKDSRLDVVKNPNTGKLFFTCGDAQGAVSKNINQNDTPVVSEVVDTVTGATFFMLHGQARNNVVMSF